MHAIAVPCEIRQITRQPGHLRTGDFFLAEEFPTIDFVSTGVRHEDGEWSWQLNLDVLRRDLASLGEWPEGKAQSRLVFIVRAAAKEPIEQLFQQVLAQPEPTLEQQFQALFNPTEQGPDQ